MLREVEEKNREANEKLLEAQLLQRERQLEFLKECDVAERAERAAERAAELEERRAREAAEREDREERARFNASFLDIFAKLVDKLHK